MLRVKVAQMEMRWSEAMKPSNYDVYDGPEERVALLFAAVEPDCDLRLHDTRLGTGGERQSQGQVLRVRAETNCEDTLKTTSERARVRERERRQQGVADLYEIGHGEAAGGLVLASRRVEFVCQRFGHP